MGSISHGPFGILPPSLSFDISQTPEELTSMIKDAWGLWQNAECPSLPAVHMWTGGELAEGTERWTFQMGPASEFGFDTDSCGLASRLNTTVYVFTGPNVKSPASSQTRPSRL